MAPTLGDAVELLERALGYARTQLATVEEELMDRPTPCEGWDLADLLAHMEDALDAFTEAAVGAVAVRGGAGPGGRGGRVPVLHEKACALLGAWSRPAPGDVVVEASGGGADLGTALLVATAALEVTVHAWDVGRATGAGRTVPPALAAELLRVAHLVVRPEDRGVRFAAARSAPAMAPADLRLLAFLGRDVPERRRPAGGT